MTRQKRTLLLLLQGCCLLCSLLLLVKPCVRWSRREWSRLQAAHLWEETRHHPAPTAASGTPAFWLRIPERGFSDLVIYQDTPENLDRHICVAQESPTVLLGHRDTHFRNLKDVEVQDLLEIEQADGSRVRFRVSEIEILPAETVPYRIQDHREKSSLLLMTCYPFQYIGAAPDRYLVWATPLAVKPQNLFL